MDHCDKKKRKTNPLETANIFSYLTFGYILGLVKRGYQKDLEEDDLYEVIERCRSKKCGDKIQKQFKPNMSICRLLWMRFGKTFIFIGIITIIYEEVHGILYPYVMSRLISYFEKGQTKISKTSAYYCAGTVIFLNVFSVFFSYNLKVFEFSIILKVQASLKSLLYRKCLKLSPNSFSETNLGNIVTILTKDIKSVEENMWLVLDLFLHTIQFLTSCCLLWYKLGNSALIGIGLLFVALPIQAYLSRLLTKLRLKVSKNTDARIQVTQEILSAIKILKMYTWEKFFNKKIAESRNVEVKLSMKTAYIHYVIVAIGILTTKGTFLILILTYIWMGYTTSTELLFYVLNIFRQITTTFGALIPANLSHAADFRASFIRLNKLLKAPELPPAEQHFSGKPSISLSHVTVHIKDKEVLGNVNLNINNPSLTLVTGNVGSGKSSLLKTILQDYPRSKGVLKVFGSMSYASQDPWLFPSSIKQNILFGENYDAERYKEVVRICALNYDLSLMEMGDETIIADRGLNLSKGQQCRINLARAVYKTSDIYLLDDSLTALDRHVQDFIFNECIKKFFKNKICVLVTHNVDHIKQADNVIVMDQGRVNISEKPENIVLKELNKVTDQFGGEHEKEDILLETEQQCEKKKVYHETKKVGKVDLVVYVRYFQFGGGFLIFSFIVLLYVIAQTCESFSDKLITQWIDLQQNVLDLKANSTISLSYYEDAVLEKDKTFGVYSLLVILNATMSLVKYYALLWFCRTASIKIHQVMSHRVVYAAMAFFDTNFIGNILNRFSLDLSSIDSTIPMLFPQLFGVLFSCIGSLFLITSVNWLFLIPAAVLFFILFFIRIIYIPTGRSLQRLEAASRSPLVGHINSSLEGLTTIRAFKAEQILKDEFDRHQDLYTSATYIGICASLAFRFWMDIICCIFIIIIILRFLFFKHDFSVGNVGLALTQVSELTYGIQLVLRVWAQLESNMTSVERALEYTNIKGESTSGCEVQNWPTDGGVRFEHVSLYYENSKAPVLNDVSFTVLPKQKIRILGRTGAGKSSIISSLFRLYDYEGKIYIDEVDITTLSLDFLRNNIAIIPQDPILFTGTIRENIDPNKKYLDEIIWKVLDRVKMKHLIPSLELKINEKGSGFSSGQKQLICLARAAITKAKIVVLDEATANMDPETDKMLHDVINEIFSNCTILTITHRLHSILDCDLVMILDSGKLVEYDNPRRLIKDVTSVFHKICKEAENDT